MDMKRFWFIPYKPTKYMMYMLETIYSVLDEEGGKGPLLYDPVSKTSGVIVVTKTDLTNDYRHPVLLNRKTKQRLTRYAEKLKAYAAENHICAYDATVEEVAERVPFS